MQLTHLLTIAVVSLGLASATPSLDARNGGAPACYGGQSWNHHSHHCECPPNKSWDWTDKKCKYPSWPKPHCKPYEKPYCSKSKSEYCPWDQHKDYCQNDGKNIVFCCKDKDLPSRQHDHYPDNDCKKCKGGQLWNPDHHRCECSWNKRWNPHKQKCEYKPLPKPRCPPKQNPYCGEKKDKWCKYDENNDYCHNDGVSTTWCCQDKDLKGWLGKLFDQY